MFVISFIVIGLIAGAIARLIVPGKDSIGFLRTIVLGMVGSLIGGFLGYVLFHKNGHNGLLQTSGLIGSIIGAVIALLIYRAMGGKRSRV